MEGKKQRIHCDRSFNMCKIIFGLFMVTVVNKHVYVLYTFPPSLPLSVIFTLNVIRLFRFKLTIGQTSEFLRILDLQWLFYNRACNISIILVPKIYSNKSIKNLLN